MDLKTKRAVVAFVERMWNPSVKLAMTMKSGATEAQIERELATKYGEIAEMMRKEGSEERCEPCERAAEIAREAFKEAIREVGGGNLTEERKEEVMEKIKARVRETLGLEI